MPFIPLFPFVSVLITLGLVGKLFSGIFPAAGNAAAGAGLWTASTYNNVKKSVSQILFWAVVGPVIWLVALGLGVKFHNWTFVAFSFVSAAICGTLLMLTVHAVWEGTSSLLKSLGRMANSLLTVIPVGMPAFDQQPFLIQILMLVAMLTGVYGLWLVLALPIKGALELIKAVANARNTIDQWVTRTVEVISGVNIVFLFLCSLVLFQMQNGLNITILPVFLLAVIFVFDLINLLFIGGPIQVSLRAFIQAMGFITLLIDSLVALSYLLPELNKAMGQWFNDRYATVLNNMAHSPAVGLLVIAAVVVGLAWGIKWCRPYAKNIGLGLLALYALGSSWSFSFGGGGYISPFVYVIAVVIATAYIYGVATGKIKTERVTNDNSSHHS